VRAQLTLSDPPATLPAPPVVSNSPLRLLTFLALIARRLSSPRAHQSMASLSTLIQSVVDNETGGFGPSPSHLPVQFADIPYAPFSKNDKLGRVVDWNQEGAGTSSGGPAGGAGASGPAAGGAGQQRGGNKYGREPKEAFGAASAGTFAYFHDEDEASFSVVAGGASAKKPGQGQGGGLAARQGNRQGQQGGRPGQNRPFQPGQRGAPGAQGQQGRPQQGQQGGRYQNNGRQQNGRWNNWGKDARVREPSVQVQSDWVPLEDIEFSRLAKLRLEVDVDEAQTLCVLAFPLVLLPPPRTLPLALDADAPAPLAARTTASSTSTTAPTTRSTPRTTSRSRSSTASGTTRPPRTTRSCRSTPPRTRRACSSPTASCRCS